MKLSALTRVLEYKYNLWYNILFMSVDVLDFDVNSIEFERPADLGEDPQLFRDGGRLSSLNNPPETPFDKTALTVDYLLSRLEHTESNLIKDREYLAMLGGIVLGLEEVKEREPLAREVFDLAVKGLIRHGSKNNLKEVFKDESVNRRVIPAMAVAERYSAEKSHTDEQLELLIGVQRALDALESQPTAPMASIS